MTNAVKQVIKKQIKMTNNEPSNSLQIDYISDIHLGFYLPYDNSLHFKKSDIKNFIDINILPKKVGEILVIAGDICEDVTCIIDFLTECSKHYEKVLFVAGNHEYYIHGENMALEFCFNSLNKIEKLNELLKDNEKIIFLDRNSANKGQYNYKGFTIAGDTLWYLPLGNDGWFFYLASSNDSRAIRGGSPRDRIMEYHLESLKWYDSIPEVDLLITHVPPVHNPGSPYDSNSCYLCTVPELKAKTWIYGHDHVGADFEKFGTRFVSNPWGYYSTKFKIKTIEITREIDND